MDRPNKIAAFFASASSRLRQAVQPQNPTHLVGNPVYRATWNCGGHRNLGLSDALFSNSLILTALIDPWCVGLWGSRISVVQLNCIFLDPVNLRETFYQSHLATIFHNKISHVPLGQLLAMDSEIVSVLHFHSRFDSSICHELD